MLTSSPRGFTLLEAVLYTAIAAVLVGAMGLALAAANRTRAHADAIFEVESQGRAVLAQIIETAQNSTGIVSPTAGSSDTSLSVSVDEAASSPTVWTVSGGELTITQGIGSPESLTDSHVVASSFTATNLSNTDTAGSVRVQFTISTHSSASLGSFYYQQTFYGTASLR